MTTAAGYWLPSDRYDQWPGCRKCLHFRGLRCAASPEGIPTMLLSGAVDHMGH